VLDCPGHQKQLGRSDNPAETLVYLRPDDDVNQSSLILQCQKVKTLRRGRRLVHDQQSGDPNPLSLVAFR
jgi:hypothetical protein